MQRKGVSSHSGSVDSLSNIRGYWEKVVSKHSTTPCQRSLHAAAVFGNSLFVHGGYDGNSRVNDFHEFHFPSLEWSPVTTIGVIPSPRDRHVAFVWNKSFYIFGGFDGSNRVNDFYEFNFELSEWLTVAVVEGAPPSPRHSHGGVVYKNSFYAFGGYDGSYRSDFHQFDFITRTWSVVPTAGRAPKPRYRATCCVISDCMYLFGGHDGNRHLNDVHVYSFLEQTWSLLQTEGVAPPPRDSHTAVAFGNSMFVYGGSTGSAKDDLYEINVDIATWSLVESTVSKVAVAARTGTDNTLMTGDFSARALEGGVRAAQVPGCRFCHVACVYEGAMYVFGGYDGANRLNDFVRFRFGSEDDSTDALPSTLVTDMRKIVNSDLLSDICFIVEGRTVHAHKILCLRCPFFNAMLTGEMMESKASEVTIPDMRHGVFLLLLEYLYTDQVEVNLESAMELFQAADRFGVERLKRICEGVMLDSISVENASHLLLAADLHHAKLLRERSFAFVLQHFDMVSKTPAFEEMGRANVELVLEILKRR